MKTLCLILTLCVVSGSTCAGERLGPVSPIVEQDMIEAIMQTLRAKEKSGELARLQSEAVERVKKHVEEPDAVHGLARTEKARTYYYDPSYTQATTVYDTQGRVIAAAGTRVNPLEYITLSTRMLFFDGRDPEQVKKAFTLIDRYKDGIKAVLVGGRPLEMMRTHKVRIYFDQNGTLTRRFGITHVPALVTQDGYRVRIEEMMVTSQ